MKEALLLQHVIYGVSVLPMITMYHYHYTFEISPVWRFRACIALFLGNSVCKPGLDPHFRSGYTALQLYRGYREALLSTKGLKKLAIQLTGLHRNSFFFSLKLSVYGNIALPLENKAQDLGLNLVFGSQLLLPLNLRLVHHDHRLALNLSSMNHLQ